MLGYGEKLVLAYFFGTDYRIDVYNVVITVITGVFIFSREIIEPAFLNVFINAIGEKDERSAWGLFNRYSRGIILITMLLSLLVYFYPGAVISLVAPGFANGKRQLAVRLIQIAFPACIFLSLSALTNITLNGMKKFVLPASADLAFKGLTLLCLVFLYKYLGIYAAVVGVIIGAVSKLSIQFSLLHRKLSFRAGFVDPVYSKNIWRLSWPLLLGVSFSQINTLAENVFASYMQEGAISALSYSKKVIDLPILIISYTLSVVVFPYFVELSVAKEKEKLTRLLARALGYITLIYLPLSLLSFLFSREIVELIFKRGAFDNAAVKLTATPLAYYSIGMVFFSLETILVIFYFANSNTRTPIFWGVVTVIENILLCYIFTSTIGYAGIALALTLSKGTKVIALLSQLKRYINVSCLYPGRIPLRI
ncbi:putative lipid II flippase MurJ [Puia dinghuensis]|uniref:Putative lipid II flippase MurJ n=1 Tax=Puia dinghuensis TaxID=1792502 RepID=A0A8J2UJH9_9BACT|nr:putative lipid II flippase MurJ [Puia dinghuensis]